MISILSIIVLSIAWNIFKFIPQHKKIQGHERKATYDNPVGNVLPYDDWSQYLFSRPPPISQTIFFLKKGVPLEKTKEIWGKGYGARYTYSTHHAPNKENTLSEFKISSCKEDRTECLPVPSFAISQKQILTM